jgi:aminodeoxyfutalosine deaminase
VNEGRLSSLHSAFWCKTSGVNITTYTARWILPVAGPPLANGTITVAGDIITAVDSPGVRTADVDLGNVAIIPGLCNAHTHLDLSGARGRIPPTDTEHFTDWLLGVIAFRRTRTPAEVQADITAGLNEAMTFGITLIGDITADGTCFDTFATAPLRSRAYFEILGLTPERLDQSLGRWFDWHSRRPDRDHCRTGLSPHAPYSVHKLHFHNIARRPPAYYCVHLAEWAAETRLLATHDGPLKSFLEHLGVWHPEGLSKDHQMILDQLRDHRQPSLIVHGNYLTPATRLQQNHTLVVCPRTHAAFGHPRHPFPHFLARGVNVALGTDSLASTPNLDLLAEAQALHAEYPEVSGETVLRMATLNGANALGFGDVAGSLTPGKSADFVAVPLPNAEAEPYELLLRDALLDAPRRTLYRGQWRP